jgi:hypothetical protein
MKNRYSREKSYSKSLFKKIVVILLTILVSFSTGYIFGQTYFDKEIALNHLVFTKELFDLKNTSNSTSRDNDKDKDRTSLLDEIDVKYLEKHLK